jgi:hypothetical protein
MVSHKFTLFAVLLVTVMFCEVASAQYTGSWNADPCGPGDGGWSSCGGWDATNFWGVRGFSGEIPTGSGIPFDWGSVPTNQILPGENSVIFPGPDLFSTIWGDVLGLPTSSCDYEFGGCGGIQDFQNTQDGHLYIPNPTLHYCDPGITDCYSPMDPSQAQENACGFLFVCLGIDEQAFMLRPRIPTPLPTSVASLPKPPGPPQPTTRDTVCANWDLANNAGTAIDAGIWLSSVTPAAPAAAPTAAGLGVGLMFSGLGHWAVCP